MSGIADNPGAGSHPTEVDSGTTTPETQIGAPEATTVTESLQPDFRWKSKLSSDFANSPTMQKFSDDVAGFNEAVKSHLSLEQMLGHEKVPIPKGDDDTEGWNRFAKAMGIPDRADQYGLPDPQIGPEFEGLNFDKEKFASVMHQFKLTPGQAKGLWETFVETNKQAYGEAQKSYREQMKMTVDQLRGEWGDAYDSNVELGQMVINRFGGDKDAQDFITERLVSDPRGVKFLAQLGNQFAESKVGDFSHKRFSLTPDQAQAEIDQIVADPNHPYNNDRMPQDQRDRAIDYVNGLYALLAKYQG